MKPITSFAIALVLFSSLSLFGQGARMRTYGSAGYTLAPPSVKSLDYDTSITWATAYQDATVGGGLQALFPMKGFDLGGDIGFTTLYSLALDNKAYLAYVIRTTDQIKRWLKIEIFPELARYAEHLGNLKKDQGPILRLRLRKGGKNEENIS